MISSFKLLGKTLSFSVLTVTCLMTSSLAYADSEYSDEEVQKICRNNAIFRMGYFGMLFIAKNDQERKEARNDALEFLKKEGISKNKKLMDKLYTPTMAFEEKETKKALKIPYEQRVALLKNGQIDEDEKIKIYTDECVLKGAKLK